MKTGDIILVSGTSTMAKIIQKFQSKQNPEAGKWNHSGIIYQTPHDTYVIEAAEIKGYKFKGAVVITPFDEYRSRMLNSECRIRILKCKEEPNKWFERILLSYVGIPYDYRNLLQHQVVRILTGLWIGRNKRQWKRMVCHEFTMTVWNDYRGIFPDCHKAKIEDIYNSTYFEHGNR